MQRTRHELERADVILVVKDALQPEEPTGPLPAAAMRIDVWNKVDLLPKAVAGKHPDGIWLSAKTGEGLDTLRSALLEAAGWNAPAETVFLARARHLQSLEEARRSLVAAAAQLERWELFAEELRGAQEALGAIAGRLSADELLGEIFSRFCIGK
jgi:tRNA modification GTPase